MPNLIDLPSSILAKISESLDLKSKNRAKQSCQEMNRTIPLNRPSTIVIVSYENLLESIRQGTASYLANRPPNSDELGDRRAKIILAYAEKIHVGNYRGILGLLCAVFRLNDGRFSVGQSKKLAKSIAEQVMQEEDWKDSSGKISFSLSSNSLDKSALNKICVDPDNRETLSTMGWCKDSLDKVKAMRTVLRNTLKQLQPHDRDEITNFRKELKSIFTRPFDGLDWSILPPQEMQEIEQKDEDSSISLTY